MHSSQNTNRNVIKSTNFASINMYSSQKVKTDSTNHNKINTSKSGCDKKYIYSIKKDIEQEVGVISAKIKRNNTEINIIKDCISELEFQKDKILSTTYNCVAHFVFNVVPILATIPTITPSSITICEEKKILSDRIAILSMEKDEYENQYDFLTSQIRNLDNFH